MRTNLYALMSIVSLAVLACGDDDHDQRDAGGDASIAPDYFACEVPSDCVVIPESCCGSCGAPVRGDAIAVAKRNAAAYAGEVCEDNGGCPACAPLFIDPTLVATCRAERCELVDLYEHEASECAEDDECRIRTPDCCPCDGDVSPGRLVAVSSVNAYEALVCDPEQACPECAPIYPSEVTASCNASGRCESHDPRVPGMDGGLPDGGDHDAGRASLCALPADPGPCDAAIPRWHFDAVEERCALFVWGGCDGNDNNFESAAACASACEVPVVPLAACEVEGVLYASGTNGIGDPVSCNECLCDDGQLICTEIHCPKACPSGTAFGVDCASCGPTDACQIVRTGCLPACDESDDCAGGACDDELGVCLNRCG